MVMRDITPPFIVHEAIVNMAHAHACAIRMAHFERKFGISSTLLRPDYKANALSTNECSHYFDALHDTRYAYRIQTGTWELSSSHSHAYCCVIA